MGSRAAGGQAPVDARAVARATAPARRSGLRRAAAAAGQLAGRDVDRPAADRHERARAVRGDGLLHGGPHRGDLLGGVELDGEDVVVALEAGERLADLLLALERGELARRQGALLAAWVSAPRSSRFGFASRGSTPACWRWAASIMTRIRHGLASRRLPVRIAPRPAEIALARCARMGYHAARGDLCFGQSGAWACR